MVTRWNFPTTGLLVLYTRDTLASLRQICLRIRGVLEMKVGAANGRRDAGHEEE